MLTASSVTFTALGPYTIRPRNGIFVCIRLVTDGVVTCYLDPETWRPIFDDMCAGVVTAALIESLDDIYISEGLMSKIDGEWYTVEGAEHIEKEKEYEAQHYREMQAQWRYL